MASWLLSAMLCAVVGGSPDCTIIHFTAAWCEPCKQIEPALQQLRQEGWTVQAVDVDRQPELVQQFRIENLPTLAILCRAQEVDRLVGAATYERILERVERAAARNQSGSPRTQLASSAAPQPIVRGQSPELSGFPLLASTAGANNSRQELFAEPAVSQRTMAQTNVRHTNTALSMEQAVARAAAATVRIRVDEANTTAYGTGTIVDVRGQEALILTCGHLFREMQPHSQLTIDLFPGTAQEINLPSELIDFKAEGEDIGLISFHIPLQIEPVPILGRGQKIGVGQPAFSFGCDHGANPTRRDTQIKSVNRYLGADNIEIVGAPAVGRSGGGLFDIQGRLIGVCNAANADDDEGIYASAEVVYKQIERLGLSELFDEGQPVAEPAAVVQLASASVASPSQGWQQPNMQQPNMQQPSREQVVPVAAAAVQPASGALPWPDQSASIPNASAGGGQNPATGQPLAIQFPANQSPARAGGVSPINSPMTASNTRQVICIVRDSEGQDKVVTIDAPPEQLLQMIQQQGQQGLR